jgi:hypothetical protein
MTPPTDSPLGSLIKNTKFQVSCKALDWDFDQPIPDSVRHVSHCFDGGKET